jgi:hypothetical protein
MRIAGIIFGVIFTLAFAYLAIGFWQLAGADDDFSVGIVQIAALCFIMAVLCWVGVWVDIRNKRRC